MAVKEEQPETTPPSERERGPEEDAAIATEDERKPPEVEGEGHVLGEAEAERADAIEVEDGGGRVPEGDIGRDRQAAGIPNVRQPLEEASCTESVGEPVNPRAAQTEVGRRINDGAGLDSDTFFSSSLSNTLGHLATCQSAASTGRPLHRLVEPSAPRSLAMARQVGSKIFFTFTDT